MNFYITIIENNTAIYSRYMIGNFSFFLSAEQTKAG